MKDSDNIHLSPPCEGQESTSLIIAGDGSELWPNPTFNSLIYDENGHGWKRNDRVHGNDHITHRYVDLGDGIMF